MSDLYIEKQTKKLTDIRYDITSTSHRTITKL
jgi:hypothetical protein